MSDHLRWRFLQLLVVLHVFKYLLSGGIIQIDCSVDAPAHKPKSQTCLPMTALQIMFSNYSNWCFLFVQMKILVPSIRGRGGYDRNRICLWVENYVFHTYSGFRWRNKCWHFTSRYEYWSKHWLLLFCIIFLRTYISWLLKITWVFLSCVALWRTPFFQISVSTIMQNHLERKGSDAYKYIARRMPIPNSDYSLTVMNKQTLAIILSWCYPDNSIYNKIQ